MALWNKLRGLFGGEPGSDGGGAETPGFEP